MKKTLELSGSKMCNLRSSQFGGFEKKIRWILAISKFLWLRKVSTMAPVTAETFRLAACEMLFMDPNSSTREQAREFTEFFGTNYDVCEDVGSVFLLENQRFSYAFLYIVDSLALAAS